MTSGRELRALDIMNILGLWLTRMTLGHGVMTLNSMNNSRLLMI